MRSPALHHVERGRGNPALLFVHGLSGSLKAWAAQLGADWPDDNRCIAIDLPGHGRSPPIVPSTVASLARALDELRARLALDDVVLVGHSMGCRVVAELCACSPAGIRGVVFVDGGLSVGDPAANLRRWEPFIRQTEAAAEQKGRDRRTQRDLWVDFVHWDATRAGPALRTIDVPVLMLQATTTDEHRRRRRLRPGETTPWTELVGASVRAGVRLEHVPDSGHFIMRDAAARTTELVAGFVEQLGASLRAMRPSATTTA